MRSSRIVQRTRSGNAQKQFNFVLDVGVVNWLEDKFLDAPVEEFGDVEFVFGGASDGVNPAELAELLAGFAENAENFSVEAELVDAAGESVRGEEDLVGAGRDTESPRSAGGHGSGVGSGLVADGGAGRGGDGEANGGGGGEFCRGAQSPRGRGGRGG